MTLSLNVRAHSEIGLVRNNNQDSAYASPSLIVVADGMGGAAAGDLASAVAIRELRAADTPNQAPKPRSVFSAHSNSAHPPSGEQMLDTLDDALTTANAQIANLVVWDHSLEGMGTTVCGAMFSGTQYGICHIGDSRGYLLRDGRFERLTHDHSWVQSLVDQGKITLEDAATHPHRSLLLKVLNGQPTHSPDFQVVDAKLGDRLLFCSDGLCGMVSDEAIAATLREIQDLDQVVASLTQAAHLGGGLDNITLVVADVVPFDPALQAVAPQVLGAAASVEIPEVDAVVPIDLGDGIDDTQPIRTHIPMAPVPMPSGHHSPPEGVIDPDQFEAFRYSPTLGSRRKRYLPMLIGLLILTLLAVLAVFGGRAYLSSRFYIGPDQQEVAIYQGLPDDFFSRFSEQVESSSIRIEDLPPYYAGKVSNSDLQYRDVNDAKEQLNTLGQLAEKCIAERAARESQQAPAPTMPSSPRSDRSSPPGSSTSGGSTGRVSPNASASADRSASTNGSASGAASNPRETASSARTTEVPTISSSRGATASSTASERPDLEACG